MKYIFQAIAMEAFYQVHVMTGNVKGSRQEYAAMFSKYGVPKI